MRTLLLVAVLLTVSACDSLIPGDYGDYGEMTARVTGDLDLNLHGTAAVSQYPDTAYVEVYLNITNDFARQIILTTADTVALRVGRYDLAGGTLSEIEYEVDNRTEQVFTGTSGSMSITSIDDEGDVFGRFEFVGVDPDRQQVTVQGSFRARDRRESFGESQ